MDAIASCFPEVTSFYNFIGDISRFEISHISTFNPEDHPKLAERIFKKEFRRRAENIISAMYTPQKMNISEKAFQEQSLDGFSRVNKIQRELSEQFNMNPILTTRLSSEIISELTTESMKKLKQMEDED